MPNQLSQLVNSCPAASLSDTRTRYGAEQSLGLLIISTDQFEAVFSIQGAQLLEYRLKPCGQSLVWLSPNAVFREGKAVRGGIPVCFPWFGAHPTDSNKPNHGFVRDRNWMLHSLQQCGDIVKVSFGVVSDTDTLVLYPHEFSARLNFELGAALDLRFEVKNLGATDMPCSWALHSYLPVENVADAQVLGLEGVSFQDKANQYSGVQVGPVVFAGEVDSVFEGVAETQIIKTTRPLLVSGSNCPTAIVWNPGAELAASMGDLGAEASREFVCVERGAAFANTWQIVPGATEVACMRIALQPAAA